MQAILITTDFSEESDRAVRVGCVFARALDLPIRLFHVIDAQDESWTKARESLQRIVDSVRNEDLECNFSMAEFMPNTRILDEAASADVRMLVMGTSGRSGIARTVRGSFTERALRGARGPVVSVNLTAAIPGKIETILVAADGSPPAYAALGEVVRLSPKLGTRRLIVAYATDEARIPDAAPFDPRQWVANATESGIDVEVEIARKPPAEFILSVAEKHGVDLIAAGTHGRSGLRRAVLGSVAETVLRRAPCPVLTKRVSSDASPSPK